MNKQLIRDLAITGGIYDCITDPYDKLKNGDHYSSVMIDLERFAEKIVKECTTAIIQDGRLNDVRSAANGCVRTIREHFGVEL